MRQMMPLRNSRVHVARWLGSLAAAPASVLFPSGCRICEALRARADRLPVSDLCPDSFRELPEEICARSGQPWAKGGDVDRDESVCGSPGSGGLRLTPHAASGSMTGAGAGDCADGSRKGLSHWGAWFAKRLFEAAQRIPSEFAADLVFPVLAARDAAEGARVQPGGSVWAASGAETRATLPASFV